MIICPPCVPASPVSVELDAFTSGPNPVVSHDEPVSWSHQCSDASLVTVLICLDSDPSFVSRVTCNGVEMDLVASSEQTLSMFVFALLKQVDGVSEIVVELSHGTGIDLIMYSASFRNCSHIGNTKYGGGTPDPFDFKLPEAAHDRYLIFASTYLASVVEISGGTQLSSDTGKTVSCSSGLSSGTVHIQQLPPTIDDDIEMGKNIFALAVPLVALTKNN